MFKKGLAVLTLSALLVGCSTDTNTETNKEGKESKAEVGEVFLKSDKWNVGSQEVLESFVKQGIVEDEDVLNAVLEELLEKYYTVSDKEIKAKEQELLDFQKVVGEELSETFLEDNKEYIKSLTQIDKAFKDIVEVTTEDEDKVYEVIKDKYEVVDVFVVEGADEDKDKIMKDLKGKTKEEVEEYAKQYEGSETVNISILNYTKEDLYGTEEDKKSFTKAGDVLEQNQNGVYNGLILLSKETIKKEDILPRIQETARFEKVGDTADIVKKLAEKNKVEITEDLQKLMDNYKENLSQQEGEGLGEEDEEVINSLIEEEEDKDN